MPRGYTHSRLGVTYSRRVNPAVYNHLAFGPDEGLLATADTRSRVAVLERGREVWARSFSSEDPKKAALDRIQGLAWSPAGDALYVLGASGLCALDRATGEPRWSHEPPRTLGFLVVLPTALAVRRDGIVAAAFDDGTVGAWTPEGECLGLWQDADTQRHLAFLPSGLLLGDGSFGLSVFDLIARRRTESIALRDRSYGLAVAPDGSVAVRTLHEAWQLDLTGEVLARTPVESGLPTIAYHPAVPLLALGFANGVLLVEPDGRTASRRETGAAVVSLAFTPDGRLALACADGSLERVETV